MSTTITITVDPAALHPVMVVAMHRPEKNQQNPMPDFPGIPNMQGQTEIAPGEVAVFKVHDSKAFHIREKA